MEINYCGKQHEDDWINISPAWWLESGERDYMLNILYDGSKDRKSMCYFDKGLSKRLMWESMGESLQYNYRWIVENTWRENRFEYFWIISNLGGHAYIVLYNTVWRVTKNDQLTKRVYLCLSSTSAFIESLIFCIQQNNTCFYNTKNNMK